MKMSVLRAGACVCVLLSTTALTAPLLAQAMPDAPPPVQSQIDENGVDVARGTMTWKGTDLAIGASGRAGLALVRNYGYNNGGHNFDLGLYHSGGITYAGTGEASTPFTNSGSTYTVADGSGATLTVSAGIFTFTKSDGTVIVYGYAVHDTNDLSRAARATSVAYASGERLTLTWVDATWCTNLLDGCEGGIWLTGVRLQAVSTSMGYQLHFNYGRANVATPSQGAAWRRLDSVSAINTTIDSCSPSAHSCTLTQAWPTVSYSGVDITDPEGRISSHIQSSLSYAIRRPSAGSANETYTVASNYGRYPVTQLVRDGLTWTYSYTVTGSTATMVVTLPGSRTRTIVSDLNVGLPTSMTNEVGQTTTYAYDGSGRLTRVTAPEGNYVQYSFDARGNSTQAQYVAKSGSGVPDIIVASAYPASCTNPVTCNLPTSTTDARGNTSDYTYDSTHGGVLTVTAPAPSGGAPRPQTRYTYSSLTQPGGGSIYRLTAVSQCQTTSSCAAGADEARTTVAYTQANLQPTTVTTANGTGTLTATSTIGYDYLARPITVDGPLSGTADTTRTRYNLASQVTGTVSPDPDGGGALKHRAQRVTYNSDSQISRVERGTVDSQTDGDWAAFAPLETRDLSYDSAARPVREALKGSDSILYAVTDISYDAVGRQECVTQRMNPSVWATVTAACTLQTAGASGPDRAVRRTYDAANRPTLSQSAYAVSGQQADEVAVAYSNNGRTAYATDAQGNRTTYEYDGLDRLVKTRFPSPATPNTSSTTDYEELTYETVASGTRASPLVASRRLRDATSIAYAYDALGRLTSEDRPGSEATVSYTYDLPGRMLTAGMTGHTLTFTYDALGRNLSQDGPLGTVSYAYDEAGRRTRMTYPGSGLYMDYVHLVTGEVREIRENGATTGIGVLGAYTYDDRGRRTLLTRGNGNTTAYTYDNVDRLTQLAQDLNGSTYDQTLTFTRNPAGQIADTTRSNDAFAWANHYGVNRNYTANGLNQYTAVGAVTPTYDARGNVQSAASWYYYSYSSENMLTSAWNQATLNYDPLRRLWEIGTGSTTTRMLYDGVTLIGEYDNAGTLQRRYVHGPGTDEPLAEYDHTGTLTRRFYHADERGSIVATSDSSGAMANINTYDEYGIPGSGNTGRFQYTGQQWLGDVGMYYYKARVYSPTLGRFMQSDPIGYGDGMNFYAYVRNDPINRVDPTGLNDDDVEVIGPCPRGTTETTNGGCTQRNTELLPSGYTIYPNSNNQLMYRTTDPRREPVFTPRRQIEVCRNYDAMMRSNAEVGAGTFVGGVLFRTGPMSVLMTVAAGVTAALGLAPTPPGCAR